MCLHHLSNNIFVLNLKKRTDRLSHITKELNKINCSNYTILESIDGSNVINNTKLKNGMYGLVLTYFKLYDICKEKNISELIIIEDDCVFDNNFCHKIPLISQELPSDWSLLYFGGNHNTHGGYPEPEIVSSNLVKVINTYSAHCILIKFNVFEELINNLKDFNIENDVMLSNLQKSHPSYSTLEKITWQIESFSNIEDRYVNYDWILKN